MLEQRSETTARSPISVKKLAHVVYEVTDVPRSTKFWTDVMGFTVSESTVNKKNEAMTFLRHGSDHHAIGLVEAKGKGRLPMQSDVLQTHHWAYEVDSLDMLFAARDYLREHQIPIQYEGRRGPGCNIGIEFEDPDGYVIEIYVNMDQIGPDGKLRPVEQFRRAFTLEDAVADTPPPKW